MFFPRAGFGPAQKVGTVSKLFQSLIAQLAEQPAVNRQVVGSSPTQGATLGPHLRGEGLFSLHTRFASTLGVL